MAYRLVNFWLPIPVGAAAYVAVDRAVADGQGARFVDEINEGLGSVTE